MSKTTDYLRIDYDGKWKILIEKAPKAFIAFFLSDIYPKIDFQYPPKLMQQDVAKVIGSKRKKGDLVTDIIMEVRLFNGEKKLLYIHIEVQSTPTTEFGEKMFKPFYRLKDKYNQEVTALALFVGEYLPQNHDHYEYSFGKTIVRYDFPTYIVKNQDKKALKASKNPFAIAVLACIYLIETKKKYESRLELKKELADFIIDAVQTKAFDEETSLAIIDFVINVMVLPDKMETTFVNHYYENYFNMENTNAISGRTIDFADAFAKAFFQKSYKTILQQSEDLKKALAAAIEEKAAKIKAEQIAKAATIRAEKAEKAEKEMQKKKETLIVKLYSEQNLSIAEIANLLGEQEAYVKTVLSKKK